MKPRALTLLFLLALVLPVQAAVLGTTGSQWTLVESALV